MDRRPDEGGPVTAEGISGVSGAANRIAILDALRGAPFPASRDELAEHVRHNDAEETTLHAIERLDDRRYDSAAEVAEATGTGVPSSGAQGSAPHPGEPQSEQARPAEVADATKSVGTLPGSQT